VQRLKGLFKPIIFVCVGLVYAGCVTTPSLREQLDALPVKQLSFYNFDPATPISDRVTDAPQELLDLYSDMDGAPLRAYQPTAAEREQINEVFERLPVRHRAVLEERLIGVYCVEGFAGSGMADYVLGPGDELYAVLILHPRVFAMSGADLVSFRAGTAFRVEDSDVQLSMDLSAEVSGLAYIVLHESTHIVDYVERHTPYVEPAMLELFGRSSRDTSFTDEVWSEYWVPGPSVDFSFQPDLQFYGLGDRPKLANTQMDQVYEALAHTPFASLYGSTSWAEDFAEFVTFYYLVHGLGAHYSIDVMRGGVTVLTYPPMDSLIVAQRAALIDPALFEPPRR
jgi:hypothetical protein